MYKKRVLIIDDEEDIREVAKVSLELLGGWEVDTSSSGAQGLTLVAELRPDVILLDVMMPGMTGPETFQELQKTEAAKGIPVILLTGKENPSGGGNFSDLGVRGVIAKPFDPLTLSEKVSGLLGWNA